MLSSATRHAGRLRSPRIPDASEDRIRYGTERAIETRLLPIDRQRRIYDQRGGSRRALPGCACSRRHLTNGQHLFDIDDADYDATAKLRRPKPPVGNHVVYGLDIDAQGVSGFSPGDGDFRHNTASNVSTGLRHRSLRETLLRRAIYLPCSYQANVSQARAGDAAPRRGPMDSRRASHPISALISR